MDLPAVQSANDGAVVLIRAEFARKKGMALEATGFSISTRGLIVTNRHVVADGGTHASKISVKFANTGAWRSAHLVRTPSDTSIDLAVLQVDDEAKFPAVAGMASTVDVPVGGAIASLGFPDGTDLPMDGANAKTTLTLGTVSKLTDDLLQIDSYASHGSSGSPVFDGDGHVVGVIFGGARGSGGRIVYAVPANRIAELVKAAK
jgi:S1-C subfamily serine protease